MCKQWGLTLYKMDSLLAPEGISTGVLGELPLMLCIVQQSLL